MDSQEFDCVKHLEVDCQGTDLTCVRQLDGSELMYDYDVMG